METKWKILELKRKPDNGLVFEVTYVMNFKLENKEDRQIGVIRLEGDPNSPDFVPYENLTEEIVLNWVQSKIGEVKISEIESSFQTRLQEKIDREKNPEFLTGKPWQ